VCTLTLWDTPSMSKVTNSTQEPLNNYTQIQYGWNNKCTISTWWNVCMYPTSPSKHRGKVALSGFPVSILITASNHILNKFPPATEQQLSLFTSYKNYRVFTVIQSLLQGNFFKSCKYMKKLVAYAYLHICLI